MLREDEQELVKQADRFVNAYADLVANLHIYESEPAAYTFALQISIQLVGKILVAAGMAN